jgi:cytochrome d ubiquinol oxidase subunit I
MVGIGVIMLVVVIVGQVLQLRRRLFDSIWFLRLCQWVAPLGFFAVLAGWITAEVGRQPWTVYGLMRTSNSVSPSLTGTDVVISLALYFVVYLIMFPTGIAFMAGLVRRGPQEPALEPELVECGRPNRPFQDAARAGVNT